MWRLCTQRKGDTRQKSIHESARWVECIIYFRKQCARRFLIRYNYRAAWLSNLCPSTQTCLPSGKKDICSCSVRSNLGKCHVKCSTSSSTVCCWGILSSTTTRCGKIWPVYDSLGDSTFRQLIAICMGKTVTSLCGWNNILLIYKIAGFLQQNSKAVASWTITVWTKLKMSTRYSSSKCTFPIINFYPRKIWLNYVNPGQHLCIQLWRQV